METEVHQQLKRYYADNDSQLEVKLGRYRIDVLQVDGTLIEIQHSSLGAFRDKIQYLTKSHDVLVVKPIVLKKRLLKLDKKGGKVISDRLSPKRGSILSLFDDLIYFTRAFPHPRLKLEVPLIEVEERRFPGHGKRRRRRENDFEVEELRMTRVERIEEFHTIQDLIALLPNDLPTPFGTGDLAKKMNVKREVARKIVYCLREMQGGIEQVGKQGNAWLYEFIGSPKKKKIVKKSKTSKKKKLRSKKEAIEVSVVQKKSTASRTTTKKKQVSKKGPQKKKSKKRTTKKLVKRKVSKTGETKKGRTSGVANTKKNRVKTKRVKKKS